MSVYLNRELSWIEFNSRVLAEGLRKDLPPLERFRFLSIVSSNFDEFFMVRMAGLKRALASSHAADLSGMSPGEQLAAAAAKIRPLLSELYRCLDGEIFPALASAGLECVRPPYTDKDGEYLASYFIKEILPVLTPLRFGVTEEESVPLLTNGRIYAAFLLYAGEGITGKAPEPVSVESSPPKSTLTRSALAESASTELVSIVEIPPVFDRVVFLSGGEHSERTRWTLLDDLLLFFGDLLFRGCKVQERMLFRIHRDADFSVDERRDEDFIEAMEEVIAGRDHSPIVRMVYSPGGPRLKERIARRLDLKEADLYAVDGPLNLGTLWSLIRIQGFDRLKAARKNHYPHPAFPADRSVWDCIKGGDILLALPYHSFDPVVRFFREAAEDPQVVSIKTALYRTSGDSPVIQALEKAALNGKHVTAVVELKARFDEERNISWAVRLEKAGVIVIYGLAQLKVHAKISQVIRREPGGLARYIHLATGNYNDKTARQYSDLSLFTANEDFGNDATIFFNTLSGYSALHTMNKLVMAPWFLKQKILELIDRETRRAEKGAPGKILAKMNALVDADVVNALYKASQAGVKVRLNVRGICTLVPGLKDLSENITVTSIVDHYLEHSRIFCFNNGGAEEFYISSADWMPRNLERRVELLVPILDPAIKEEVRNILDCYFRDTSRAWILAPDGSWKRPKAEKPFEAQAWLLAMAAKRAEQPWKTRKELVVRRST
ncbi:MAG: polyphosphate kinase 1 [Treponema sp.]|jgi:polyphosphate kinase|nr:polyphosphate kinase 1 [Treponema sp.]